MEDATTDDGRRGGDSSRGPTPSTPGAGAPTSVHAEASQVPRLAFSLTLVGAALAAAGTWLHPTDADPNDSLAAFTEYAQSSRVAWVTSHLLQLAGLVAIVLAVVLVTRTLAGTARSSWISATTVLGTATIAVAGTLQAVDGIALKATVDLWAEAPAGDESSLFAAAVAVRHVEIGLAALFALVAGLTMLGFGLVLWDVSGGGRTLGVLSFSSSVASGIGGFLIALDGFSPAAMIATGAGGALVVIATATAAGWIWRRIRRSSFVH